MLELMEITGKFEICDLKFEEKKRGIADVR